MSRATRIAVAALSLFVFGNPGQARAGLSKADSIIAASKRATGGANWDKLPGCYEEGVRSGGATYKTWFSFRRYGLRNEGSRGGATRMRGFNGQSSWQITADGGIEATTDPEVLKESILTAYLSTNGFYFPKRFPAVTTYLRETGKDGHIYDVVEVAPTGARPLEIWFDQKTHLIRRVVDIQGAPPVTVEADDYRRVGKVLVAFSLTVFGPDGTMFDKGNVTALNCQSVDETMFEPPKKR